MQWIDRLDDLRPHYDVLLCDVWGVVHNGKLAFAPACAALQRYRAAGGHVVLLTNAPRPASDVRAQLRQLAVPDAAYDLIVTSGMATQDLLRQYAGRGGCYAIGPDKDNGIYDGTGVVFTPLAEAAFISCTGLVDDETEDADTYADLLAEASARQVPMICANPDKWVHRGQKLVPCAGLLGAAYAALGADVLFGGKPHAPIYDLAQRAVTAHLGGPVDAARILAIGDGLDTDVLGANQQGLDCLFIGAGLAGVHDAASASVALQQGGRHARYAMGALV